MRVSAYTSPQGPTPQIDSTHEKSQDLTEQCLNLGTKSSTHESAEDIHVQSTAGPDAQHLMA